MATSRVWIKTTSERQKNYNLSGTNEKMIIFDEKRSISLARVNCVVLGSKGIVNFLAVLGFPANGTKFVRFEPFDHALPME